MATKKSKITFTEWFDAEEMHKDSKKWSSELSFIKEEQEFLKNLIQSFAVKPLDQKQFERINDFKKAIEENEYRLKLLLTQVLKHKNQIGIMMDEVNQPEMEKAYRKTHKKLHLMVNNYLLDYRSVKQRGFVKLALILKKEKQKLVLDNPEYKVRTTE